MKRSGEEWFRFDAYETVVVDGRQYVQPLRRAKLSIYRPFDQDYLPKILVEYLELARDLEIENQEGDTAIQGTKKRSAARIVDFASKYGLPGTFWQCTPAVDYTTNGDRVFIANSWWSVPILYALKTPASARGFGLLNSAQVLRFFQAEQLGAETAPSQFDVDLLASPLKAIESYAQVPEIYSALNYEISFLKQYAEPVLCIEREALRFLGNARVVADSLRDDDTFPEIDVDNIGLSARMKNGRLEQNYRFPSLISALQIMFTLSTVAGPAGQIRFCALPECNRPFIARNERARYCNESHSNCARQRSWNQRLREEKTKKEGKANGRKRSRKTKG